MISEMTKVFLLRGERICREYVQLEEWLGATDKVLAGKEEAGIIRLTIENCPYSIYPMEANIGLVEYVRTWITERMATLEDEVAAYIQNCDG